MKANDVLIAEISGKRPGSKKQRLTERFYTDYDHLIISNNSDGYISEWKIVNVPEDYCEFYKSRYKTSDNAWYAPMNRSYAIKYAREHGYKYLVQLADNIKHLELSYCVEENGMKKKYRTTKSDGMMDDFVDMLCCVRENTNAAMVGCGLSSLGVASQFLSERYVYSFFALDLAVCPDAFHGDFEDDIEYRLKLAEMGLPSVQVCPMNYSKVGQKSGKDETGNRAAYTKAGLKRGEHMKILHGDVYTCGYSRKTASVRSVEGEPVFKHKIKPIKLGVIVKNRTAIDEKMKEILKKNAVERSDKVVRRESKNMAKQN